MTLLTRQPFTNEYDLHPVSILWGVQKPADYWQGILLNVLLFLPLGTALPYCLNSIVRKNVAWTILLCFVLSAGIECVQLIFSLGFFEMDDILCNTVGGAFGAVSFLLYTKMKRLKNLNRHYLENHTMAKENTELFDILKACLLPNIQETTANQRTALSDRIVEELRAQALEALPILVFPDKHNLKYIQVSLFVRMVHAQKEALALLQREGIPAVVIKGTAAGMYYPAPYLRTYGDIDILVHPKNYLSSIRILTENDYHQNETVGEYHTAYRKDGFLFELHQSPPGLKDVKEGEYILQYLLSGLDQIQTAVIEQPACSFPVLPWKQNGLEIIWHFREHLYNGIGLRHVIDWMMFVHSCLSTDVAFEEFKDVLDKAGLKTLAVTVTRMCQIYLGLDQNIAWCRGAEDSLCAELMEYILEQGNFGCKRGNEKAAKVLTRYRTPVFFFKGMQKKGLLEWQAAKKYKALRPFAWTYVAWNGFRRYGLHGEWKKLADSRVLAKKRKAMFDRLY